MTLKLNDIVIDSADTLQLDYGVGTNPHPLQISNNGSITITINAIDTPVVCNSITFTVMVGSDSGDLTTDAVSIAAQAPDGWSVTPDNAGGFTFTPKGGSITIKGTGYTFELNNIKVNDQVGGTRLKIKETVNNQPQPNKDSVPLSKFPQDFALQYLQVRPPSVAPEGTVNVSWSGSGGTAYGYSLNYNGTTIPNLPNVDSYPVTNLQETTVFTLNITAGGDSLYQQQCTATVTQPAIGEFGIVGDPANVLPGSTIQLYWQTENVDHCALSLNGVPIPEQLQIPANAPSTQPYSITVPLFPSEYQYTLTAYPKKDNDTGGTNSTVEVNVPLFIKSNSVHPNPASLTAVFCPTQIVMSPDGSKLYTVETFGAFTIVSTVNHEIVLTYLNLTLENLQQSYSRLALSRDGSCLYCASMVLVNDAMVGKVLAINTSNHQVSTIITGGEPRAVAIDSQNEKYLVVMSALSSGSKLTVYDSSNNYSAVKDLSFDGHPLILVGNPNSSQFLTITIDNSLEGCLYNYSLQNNTANLISSNASFVLFSQKGDFYYVANTTPAIEIREATTNQVLQTIPLPAVVRNMVLHPTKLCLYAILADNNIAWIDVSNKPGNNSLVATAPIGIDHTNYAAAIHPNGTPLYLTASASMATGELWVFDI